MVVSWPSTVPHKFVRATYARTPEDVVQHDDPQYGPFLRSLFAASRYQTISGEISCTLSQAGDFEDFRTGDLRYQREPVTLPIYDHPTARNLTVRMVGRPVVSAKSTSMRRIRLEFRSEPQAPSASTLSTLAGLHKASPASWPSSVPGCPRVEGYQFEPQVRTRFSNERNSPGAVSPTRLEGKIEQVSLLWTSAELETFETWFESDAALGARDIYFPVASGVHLGCFAGPYTVSGTDEASGWLVTFERYLEARP